MKKMSKDDKELRKLNHALQRYVQRTDIQSRLHKLFPHSAESEQEGDRLTTQLDQDQVGRIPGFIHEILHWYYEKQTEDVPYTIHEQWITATEKQMYEFFQRDKRRMDYWRRVCRRQYGK